MPSILIGGNNEQRKRSIGMQSCSSKGHAKVNRVDPPLDPELAQKCKHHAGQVVCLWYGLLLTTIVIYVSKGKR